MGSKGSQTQTSTSAPNPQAGAAYSQLLNQALNVGATPYQAYTGEYVAPVNQQQSAGIANINQNAGYAQPFINTAAGLALQGASPINQSQIQQYVNPYTQNVVNSTEAQFANQNAQQQEGILGNAIAQGALGGNRTAIAQSELANQQQLAQAPVIAGLESQGYTTGLNTALAEQQAAAQGAYSLGNLGVAGQNAALTGATSQIGAGTLEQQTQQASDQALYQAYINQMAYPFQTTQWESGIASGLGSQMGGTSTTTGPPPNQTGQDIGLGIAGLGTLGSMFAAPAGGTSAMAGIGSFLSSLSDRRAKENIKRIGKLFDGQTIYRFNYKGDQATRIGLIAQNVERHHPDAIHEVGGYKHVDYDEATKDAIRRAHGGGVANFDTGGGASYSTFGGGFGTPTMPYSGGHAFVPTIGITHGSGPPRPPGMPQQPQSNVAQQMSQIGNLAKMLPTGNAGPIGTSPAVNSPIANPSGSMSGDAIWYRGGRVGRFASGGVADGIVLPRGYADGGGPDFDQTFADAAPNSAPQWLAPAQGVVSHGDFAALPATVSPTTQPTVRPSPVSTPGNYQQQIIREAQAQDVDPDLMIHTARQESGLQHFGRDGSVMTSPKGAVGVMQLEPATARDLGVDPYNPSENIHGGVSYMRQMLDRYGGDQRLAAAAYNAGPGRVDAYLKNGTPLPAETQGYVRNVAGAPSNGVAPSGPMALSFSPDTHGVDVGDTHVDTTAPQATGVMPAITKFASDNSNLWPALMSAGFGMMASRSPFLGVAVGQGATEGLQTYAYEKQQQQATALKQSEIDMAARKLAQEADLAQKRLAVETLPYSQMTAAQKAEQDLKIFEAHKPILRYMPDGSQMLVDPYTGKQVGGEDYTAPGGNPLKQPPPPTSGAPSSQASPAVVKVADNLPAGLQPPPVERNEEYLQSLDPQMAKIVKAMVDYQINPAASFSMRTPPGGGPSERERMVRAGINYDPNYDQTMYPAKQKAVNDFLSGTSPQSSAAVMTAGNTAILHASELYDLVDQVKALPPDQQTWFASTMDGITKAATATGVPYAAYAAQAAKNSGLLGTPAGEALSRWAGAKQRYSEEVTKFYSGGNGSEEERNRSLALLDENKSAAELKGVMAQDMKMLRDKVTQYDGRLMAGMGPAMWRAALKQDPNLVTVYQNSRNVLDRILTEDTKRRLGAPQATAPAGTPANAPAQSAVPQRKFFGGKWYIRGPNGEAVVDPNQ